MTPEQEKLREIFAQALAKTSREEREAYLATACSQDAALRRQVDSLLEAHAESGDFLNQSILTPKASRVGEGPGNVIGRYKLLQQIGEGGFGVVFMAEQQEPVRRLVALKILKPGMDTKEVVARFEAGRQALALMDHPNIARVLDGGATQSGRPYFVMELVKGVPITDFCEQHQLTVEERLRLFIKVCAGVQHAHQKGVIHRDLKPSNVLVTRHDGEAVPKVIDFGIAKAIGQKLTERTLFTRFEQLIGTPAYMSPEQAEWSGLDIDTRSDLYSLGVLLYELLTGTTPLEKETLARAALDEVRRMIREIDPPRPSTRLIALLAAGSAAPLPHPALHRLRGDLDWVVMKCLEKERTRRYETVNGLAQDIQRHLNGEAVLARPPSTAYLVCKFVRKHRLEVAAAAAVTLALVVGLILALVAFAQARREREAAQGETRLVRRLAQAKEQQRRLALERLYLAHLRIAYQDYETGQIKRMLEGLRRVMPAPGDPDLRGWEWYYLRALCERSERSVLAHAGGVQALSCEPQGRRLASAGADNSVRIWDVTDCRLQRQLTGHSSTVNCVAWNPAGGQLASGAEDGKAVLWDAVTGRKLWVLNCGEAVLSLAWSSEGQRLAVGGQHKDGIVTIWDATSGQKVASLAGNDSLVHSLAWQPGGPLLAVGENAPRCRIQIWDAKNGRLLRTFKAHSHYVAALAWRPDGQELASASGDQRIRIWDTNTWQARTIDAAHNGVVSALAWSDDGRWLVSGGGDGLVKLWDARGGGLLEALRGHQGPVTAVGCLPHQRRLLSSSEDATLRLWKLEDNPAARALPGHGALAWSPNGNRLAAGRVGAGSLPMSILDTTTWHALLSLPAATTQQVWSVAWSPDGRRIAAGFWGGGPLQVWETGTGSEVLTIAEPHQGEEIRSVAWSPNGRCLATAGTDRTVRLWDVETRQNVLTFGEHQRNVSCAVWHPDGRRLASKDFAGRVLLWEAATGRVLRQFLCPGATGSGSLGHVDSPYGLGWSPDGQRLAAASGDGSVVLWNLKPGAEPQVLRGHTSLVRSISWSPDGRRLVSGAEDRTLRIWDAQSGSELLVLPCPLNRSPMVAWSPSGRMIGFADSAFGASGTPAVILDSTPGLNVDSSSIATALEPSGPGADLTGQ